MNNVKIVLYNNRCNKTGCNGFVGIKWGYPRQIYVHIFSYSHTGNSVAAPNRQLCNVFVALVMSHFLWALVSASGYTLRRFLPTVFCLRFAKIARLRKIFLPHFAVIFLSASNQLKFCAWVPNSVYILNLMSICVCIMLAVLSMLNSVQGDRAGVCGKMNSKLRVKAKTMSITHCK